MKNNVYNCLHYVYNTIHLYKNYHYVIKYLTRKSPF